MFRQAFVVTLLNPKGLVFFVALAPPSGPGAPRGAQERAEAGRAGVDPPEARAPGRNRAPQPPP
jgi:hypothetical protein